MTLEQLLALINEGKELPEGTDAQAIIALAMETDAAGLKGKNAKLLTQIKGLKDSATSLPEGFDAELWATLLAEHESKGTDKLKAEQKWAELQKILEDKHGKVLNGRDVTIKSLETALSTQLVDNAAMTALNKAKGNAALMLPHVKAFLRMATSEDGEYSAQVVGADGEPRFSMEKAGELMSITELVNEFKANEVYNAGFTADNSGGGAGGGGGAGAGGGVANPFAKGTNFNLTAQAKMMNSDPALALKMKEAAKVTA